MASIIRRSGTYYIDYYLGERRVRQSLGTDNLNVAKAKKNKFELDRAQGNGNTLPTKTPLPQLMDAYVAHLRTTKPAKSAQTEIYYLRSAFGPIRADHLRL